VPAREVLDRERDGRAIAQNHSGFEADVPSGGRVGDESDFVQLRNSRTDRLLRNFLYTDFPAGIANENVHHWNHPESWKGADKRHHMAASGARSIVG
jgi:hypothetical protein